MERAFSPLKRISVSCTGVGAAVGVGEATAENVGLVEGAAEGVASAGGGETMFSDSGSWAESKAAARMQQPNETVKPAGREYEKAITTASALYQLRPPFCARSSSCVSLLRTMAA